MKAEVYEAAGTVSEPLVELTEPPPMHSNSPPPAPLTGLANTIAAEDILFEAGAFVNRPDAAGVESFVSKLPVAKAACFSWQFMFTVFRAIVLWHWKIDEQISLLKETRDSLRASVRVLPFYAAA